MTDPNNTPLENEEEVFQYLDNLRESSETNMFGAAPYVAAAFDMDAATARRYLARWMTTFSDRHPRGGEEVEGQ